MNGQPELSVDAIINGLTALSEEREREREAIPIRISDGGLSEIDRAARLGMALGIMQAIRHIESMRVQAANERADVQAEIERVRLQLSVERTRAFYIEMRHGRGLRKRDGDV
jgi:hypothetical protein